MKNFLLESSFLDFVKGLNKNKGSSVMSHFDEKKSFKVTKVKFRKGVFGILKRTPREIGVILEIKGTQKKEFHFIDFIPSVTNKWKLNQ